ncbi:MULTISPECIES: sensor histidine kinase [Terrisporobacter]|nr:MULTISPECIES: histidine kinase [Terrisporobacter]MCC3670202.1 histidine kinase [Terrisporobacter mayombei]MDU6984408.1 histidine kinase [Terrisporobacter othiniensis]
MFKQLLQKEYYTKSDLNKLGIIFGIITIISAYGNINIYGVGSIIRNIVVVSVILLFGRRAGVIVGTISIIHRLIINIYSISLEVEIIQLLVVIFIALFFQPRIKEKSKAMCGILICTSSILIMYAFILLFEYSNRELIGFVKVFIIPALISQVGTGLFINMLEDIRNERIVVEQEKEIERLKTNIAKAELKALQAQINPHFLFNTLNAISILVRKDPQEARRVIFKLSHYLRYNLELKVGLIDLKEEIEQTKTYLEIEQVRFKDKLEIIYDIDEDIDVKIPSLIIQPIVENAIVHGILKSKEKGKLIISIKKYKQNTNICIENKGIPIEERIIEEINNDQVEENKIGLYNVHCRLKYQYGQGLNITRLDDGTRVEFKVGGD